MCYFKNGAHTHTHTKWIYPFKINVYKYRDRQKLKNKFQKKILLHNYIFFCFSPELKKCIYLNIDKDERRRTKIN